MEPTRRPSVGGPGWNDRAAVALLFLVAGHLLAAEPASAARPLTLDRLARFVAAHDLPPCIGDPIHHHVELTILEDGVGDRRLMDADVGRQVMDAGERVIACATMQQKQINSCRDQRAANDAYSGADEARAADERNLR